MRRWLPNILLAWLLVAPLNLHADATRHIVQRGETLGGIALQHGVTARALQQHNALSNPDRLSVGQVLLIPPRPGAPVPYTVQRGDTLSGIAQAHGVTTAALVALNELDAPDRLSEGQVIMVPATSAPIAVLPPSMRRDLDRIRPRPGWTHIVIHHSGTARGNVQDMDRYHREHRRMVNGLGYHFVIGNGNGMRDGEIAIGPRWRRQQDGGHLASAAQNRHSIGICLVGNFDQTHPTPKQMESLRALVRYLQRRSNIPVSNVTTHTRINVRPTACPGRHFPTDAFLQSL